MSKKKPLLGTWLQIPSPSIAEITASQGFDWVCVDLEHGAINLETMVDMFRAIKAANNNVATAVRIPNHDPSWISRCLDAGAQYLIVPKVNTLTEASKIVQAAKYPPRGRRGIGYARCNSYGHHQLTGRDPVHSKIIIQVEDIKSVENLRGIMSVPGIDGAFIGPLDLAASIIYDIADYSKTDLVRIAVDKFENIMKPLNKLMGMHIVEPVKGDVLAALKKGYNFVAMGVDTSLLTKAMSNLFEDE